MIRMLIWSYDLDRDFSGRYICCTQQDVVHFQQEFWARFSVGAKLALAGCLAVSLAVSSRAGLKAGCRTLLAGLLMFLFALFSSNFHGWSGASAYGLTFVILAGGALLSAVAGLRLGWGKLRTDAVGGRAGPLGSGNPVPFYRPSCPAASHSASGSSCKAGVALR